jgi:putative ABC transport system permease protein
MFSSPAWDFLDWLLAYYAMNRWLGNFAYPVRIGVDIFGFSFVLAVVVASLTIFYHSVKALLDNPIDSLRYE